MLHILYKHPVKSIIIATPLMSWYAAYKEEQLNAERFLTANIKKMNEFNRCLAKYYPEAHKCNALN